MFDFEKLAVNQKSKTFNVRLEVHKRGKTRPHYNNEVTNK